MEDTDKKSHIVYEALASMSSTVALEKDSVLNNANNNWDITSSGWVYIQLEKNKTVADVGKYLEDIDNKQYADNELVDYRFHLQNLLKINPGPLIGNQIGPGMPLIFVYFLSGLALLVMVSACFNYTNLSIAKSIKRAKEVGVRKVAGAMKSQLFFQFLTESIIMALLSFVIALIIVVFAEPAFKQLTLVSLLKWQLTFDPLTLIITFVFTMAIGTLAGLFPSLVMSSFKPIKVLKDAGSLKLFSKMGLRKTLLTAQLVLSLFFIVSVVLLHNQLELMLHTDKGFTSEHIINIHLMKTDGEKLKTSLEQKSYIERVTLASHIPAAGTTYDDYFKKELEDERIPLHYFSVDEDYLDIMGIELIAGRNINYQAETDTEIVVNEMATKRLGYESAHGILGETLYKSDSSLCTIVGVIKDYRHSMLMEDIAPMALRNTGDRNIAHVRINASSEAQAIEQIKSAWADVNPEKQISYKALNTEISEYYEMTFGDLAKLIGVFAFLALTVSSLGMLGMAIYSTQVRIREVSIRKVLGASEKQVIYTLSKGFLKLMVISVLLALPLAYFVNDLWLQNLSVRTDINMVTIVFSTGLLSLITLLTVGSQAWRVSSLNPADTLKTE